MNTCKSSRRERWRADLNDYHATALDEVGLPGAHEKRQEANLRRGYADVVDNFLELRDQYLAELEVARENMATHGGTLAENVTNPAVVMAYKEAQDELIKVRRTWRGIDAFVNGARGQDIKVKQLLKDIGLDPDAAPVFTIRQPITMETLDEPSDEVLT